MRCRPLGASGLRVSQLFLGAMTFADGFAHGAGRGEAQRIVDAYADAGGNVIDTAVNYRDGASEQIVGEVLAGRRDRFVLCTKYGVSRDRADPNAAGGHRKNLRLSLETSLRRLRTDYIDVYYLHLRDQLTPVEETMRALDDAVTCGKVLHLGLSDTPAWVAAQATTLAHCHGWNPPAVLQARYSLLSRDAERDLIPAAEALEISLAAWSPLGGGVLSGKYTGPGSAQGGAPGTGPGSAKDGAQDSARLPAASITERQHAVVRAVSGVADELGATAAQVALAWTMTRSPAVHPILGVRRLDQLEDNLQALAVELPPESVAQLEAATSFEIGFPHDFITDMHTFVFGEAAERVGHATTALRS
jgi:aryl-alcohol dehydrogenase-like predicted oxidoreductase